MRYYKYYKISQTITKQTKFYKISQNITNITKYHKILQHMKKYIEYLKWDDNVRQNLAMKTFAPKIDPRVLG